MAPSIDLVRLPWQHSRYMMLPVASTSADLKSINMSWQALQLVQGMRAVDSLFNFIFQDRLLLVRLYHDHHIVLNHAYQSQCIHLTCNDPKCGQDCNKHVHGRQRLHIMLCGSLAEGNTQTVSDEFSACIVQLDHGG